MVIPQPHTPTTTRAEGFRGVDRLPEGTVGLAWAPCPTPGLPSHAASTRMWLQAFFKASVPGGVASTSPSCHGNPLTKTKPSVSPAFGSEGWTLHFHQTRVPVLATTASGDNVPASLRLMVLGQKPPVWVLVFTWWGHTGAWVRAKRDQAGGNWPAPACPGVGGSRSSQVTLRPSCHLPRDVNFGCPH